jgi:hypothetical protein
MLVVHNSIFREKALKHYAQSRKRDILPNFSSIPAAIFSWVLLGLLIATGLLVWDTQVPLYTTGTGIVIQQPTKYAQSGNRETDILLFFSPNVGPKLRAGLPVQLNMGATGQQLSSAITEIMPGTVTPREVLQSYGLQVSNPVLKQPAILAFVSLGTAFPNSVYDGSIVSAQVKIGTQALALSLISV